jgi:signal peptidase II
VQERGPAPPIGEPAPGQEHAKTRFLVAATVAACVIAVDQLTKSWAVNRLSRGSIHIFWKLDLQLEYNSGSSFSFAQGWAPVIGGIAVVIVAVLVVMVRRARSNSIALALGLVIGGALGNLSDRVFRSHHGSVVDFIALHFWPTFNVADSCVVVGSILLVIFLWRSQTPGSADS